MFVDSYIRQFILYYNDSHRQVIQRQVVPFLVPCLLKYASRNLLGRKNSNISTKKYFVAHIMEAYRENQLSVDK